MVVGVCVVVVAGRVVVVVVVVVVVEVVVVVVDVDVVVVDVWPTPLNPSSYCRFHPPLVRHALGSPQQMPALNL